MLTVPPYPYVVGESSDVPLDQGWVVRPQLFFSCHLRPRGARLPRRANYTYGPDDIQKLYEPSPTPIPYVGLVAGVLGRVPLMLLFLLGNSTPTIPHQLRQHRGARFPHGLAYAADEPRSRAGREATSMRRTNGCGNLGGANRVLGACQWLRLRSGA